MKKCVDCIFLKRGVVDGPDGRPHTAFVCGHDECCDPVNGDPLLCGTARTSQFFCRMDAIYFKKREEQPQEDKKVIQLS